MFEKQDSNITNPVVGTVEGNWLKIRGDIKQKWGEFTDNELDEINGSKEKLVGNLMSKYNMSREAAQKEIDRLWF